jgi:hypothetical protein
VSHVEFRRIIHALLHRNKLLTRAPLNYILSGIHLILPTDVFFEIEFNIMFLFQLTKGAPFLKVLRLDFRVPSHSLILFVFQQCLGHFDRFRVKNFFDQCFHGCPKSRSPLRL